MAISEIQKELREINQRIIFHREEKARHETELDRLRVRRNELREMRDSQTA